MVMVMVGHGVAQLVEALRKIAGSIPDGVIGSFLGHTSSGRTGIDSASNRNQYEEYFLGGGLKTVGE
jgi:hypothetical protein